jgi:hypothetical protein
MIDATTELTTSFALALEGHWLRRRRCPVGESLTWHYTTVENGMNPHC